MPYEVRRDFIGYGANPPDPKWPGGARLAVNFVMNYEEGSEPSIQDGEGHTEIGLSDASRMGQSIQGRDLAAEGLFEYGSRVGFWRLMRLFQERGLPMTIFGCGLAMERNPEASAAIAKSGFDVCSHGWRWIKHYELDEATEREHIRKAIVASSRR
jgi:allantoinase